MNAARIASQASVGDETRREQAVQSRQRAETSFSECRRALEAPLVAKLAQVKHASETNEAALDSLSKQVRESQRALVSARLLLSELDGSAAAQSAAEKLDRDVRVIERVVRHLQT